MAPDSQIKQEFIQDFGDRYQSFGLSKLMGRIVGLLIFEEGPLSLDEIAEHLQVSKGPVSQITRRLNENGLLRKVWVPGSRRDYYAAEDEIFLRAFATHAHLLGQNQILADKYRTNEDGAGAESSDHFQWRIEEMHRFYELMGEHLQGFMNEWRVERRRMNAAWDGPPAAEDRRAGNDGG
jgi:DNA-binding transcriptional regulator GbsR (MarR family)